MNDFASNECIQFPRRICSSLESITFFPSLLVGVSPTSWSAYSSENITAQVRRVGDIYTFQSADLLVAD